MRPPRRLILVAAVLVLLALTAVVFFRWGASGEPPAAAPTASPEPTVPPTLSPAEIFSALAPSVVSIESTGRATATGTGVVANAEGIILTAFHVVRDATAIEVTFADGTRSAATVVGSDPVNDIAALVADSGPAVLVPAVLGNAGRLAVGDDVVAIGNPLGLTLSTTSGVVSGLNRVAVGRLEGGRIAGLIQFDAAVNPGSSGGPLVNARGETVAIVVSLANPTTAGTFIGIGFAVPIGTALAAGGGDGDGPPGPQQ